MNYKELPGFLRDKLNFPWFRRFGILFIPGTIAGWVIFLAALGYAVYTFIDIDRRSHSVSDTLMNFVFNLFIIGIIYTLIALITSHAGKKNDTGNKIVH